MRTAKLLKREGHNTNRYRVYSIEKSGDLVINPLQSQGSIDGLDSNAYTRMPCDMQTGI